MTQPFFFHFSLGPLYCYGLLFKSSQNLYGETTLSQLAGAPTGLFPQSLLLSAETYSLKVLHSLL